MLLFTYYFTYFTYKKVIILLNNITGQPQIKNVLYLNLIYLLGSATPLTPTVPVRSFTKLL